MIEATFGDKAGRLMALGRIPQRHAAAPSRVIEGSAVVIQTRKAEVSTLDEIGTLVWSAINGRRSEAEIASMICASFEVALDAATADVAAFLDDLALAALVEFRA